MVAQSGICKHRGMNLYGVRVCAHIFILPKSSVDIIIFLMHFFFLSAQGLESVENNWRSISFEMCYCKTLLQLQEIRTSERHNIKRFVQQRVFLFSLVHKLYLIKIFTIDKRGCLHHKQHKNAWVIWKQTLSHKHVHIHDAFDS